MIDSAGSDIDVDELMARLRRRVSELRSRPQGGLPVNALWLRTNVFTNSMEAYANIADQKLQIRTQWPSHIGNRFPFNLRLLRRVILALLAFVFKDQRHVNAALVAGCREQISLNRHLTEQIQGLRDDIEALEALHGGVDGDTSE